MSQVRSTATRGKSRLVCFVMQAVISANLQLLRSRGYNRFQSFDERTTSAWFEVPSQWERLADVVPNTVAAVAGHWALSVEGTTQK